MPLGLAAVGAIGGGVLAHNSSGASSSAPVILNPARRDLNFLFGFGKHKRPRKGSIFGNQFKDAVQDFTFNPIGLSQTEEDFFGQTLDDPTFLQGLFDSTFQDLGTARDFALDAAETGFRTDATPIFDEAIRRFNTDLIPELAETSGLGVTSSGFIDTSQEAASELLGQASLAQVDLDEAAAARRFSAIPLFSQLSTAQSAFPTSFTSSLFDLGQQRRNLLETNRARPIDVFSSLFQLGNAAPPTIQFGEPPQGPGPLGALANGLPQLLSGLGGL